MKRNNINIDFPEQMKVSKSNPSAPICCPNIRCKRSYTSSRAIAAHFDKSPECAQSLKNLLIDMDIFPTKLLNNIPTETSSVQSVSSSLEDLDDNFDTQNNEPSPVCFDKTMLYQTKLLKILNDANVPHNVYRKIIDWGIEVQKSNILFSHMMKTRKGIINHTERLMPWLQATKPKEVKILLETLEEPQPTNVILFDFKKQLLSLLNDKELFGDINNLDINPDNPFGYYKAPDNVLSTVNSGM